MTDYISEAEALSEIYDGFESDFKPYSKSDRRDYVDAKSSTFPTSKVGKWVITQNPRRNKGVVNILYLVDRNLTKRFWWSPDSFYAMIFENESAARKHVAFNCKFSTLDFHFSTFLRNFVPNYTQKCPK